MANPSVTANTNSGDGAAGAAITPSLSSLTAGNTAVLLIAHNSATAVPTPAGWAAVPSTANTQNPTGTTSDRSIAAFTKTVASSTESASLTTSGKYTWTMFEVQNTAGVRASSGNTGAVTTAGANPTANSGAGVAVNDLIVSYVVTMTASSTFTAGAGYAVVPTAAPSQTNVSNRAETKTSTGTGATAAPFVNASTTLWSELVFAMAPQTVPVAPGTPTGTGGNGQVTLSWSDGSTGGSAITDHHVYVYTAPSGGAPVQTMDTLSTSTSGVVVSGLTNGTSYYVEVTSTNAIGESSHSARSAAITPTPFSLVQSGRGSGNGAGNTYLPTNAFAAGNLVVLTVVCNVSIAGVSDSNNGAYTRVAPEISSGANFQSMWYHLNVASGKPTITLTGGTGNIWESDYEEWSGASTTAAPSAVGTLVNASTATPSASTTSGSAMAGDLGVCAFGTGAGGSEQATAITAGWTLDVNSASSISDQVMGSDSAGLSAGGVTVSITMPIARVYLGVVATFSAPIAPPTSPILQAVKRASTY